MEAVILLTYLLDLDDELMAPQRKALEDVSGMRFLPLTSVHDFKVSTLLMSAVMV